MLNVLLCLTVLLAYPDSARVAGVYYGGTGIGGTSGPRVSARDNEDRIHLVYSKNWGPQLAESSDIFHTFSSDEGLTWSPCVNISGNDDSLSCAPAMAVDRDGTLHCVWFQYLGTLTEARYDYFYAYKRADSSWSAPVNISRMSTSTNYAEYSSICTDTYGGVHVAFEYMRGMPDVFYTTRVGDSWTAPVATSASPQDDGVPAMVADSRGRLHLCWRLRGTDSGYVMYSRRDTVWTPPARVAACYNRIDSPTLAVGADDRVHLVYSGGRESDGLTEVYYACLSGDSWSVPENLSNSASVHSTEPTISTDEAGRVYVIWTEGGPTAHHELLCRVLSGTWFPAVNVSQDSSRPSYGPRLSLQSDSRGIDLLWAGLPEVQAAMSETFYLYYMKLSLAGLGCGENLTYRTRSRALVVGPSPFRGKLHIQIGRLEGECSVAIYDMLGRDVVLLSCTRPGQSDLTWDGRDGQGRPVKGGVYFIVVQSGEHAARFKVVKLR